MILITYTPEPTVKPTPTYQRQPTPVPLVCGAWVEIGTTCVMPSAPNTPTPPMPICPTLPETTCEWRGQLAGTPVAAADVVRERGN